MPGLHPSVPAALARVALVSAVAVGAAPIGGPARADTDPRPGRVRVAILGFQAAPDEASFARDLTGTVRWAARKERRWDLVPGELDAAMAAHGCLEPDEPCLAGIARDLDVDALVFGRVAENRDRSWSVGIYYFDRHQARVTRSTIDLVERAQADVDALRPRAKAWVDTLAAGP